MVASGICTPIQYYTGRKELINRVCSVYDRLSSTGSVHIPVPTEHAPNQWSSDEDEEAVIYVSPNTTLAEEELSKYESYNKSRFQPQLKPTKTLGSFHEDGNHRDLHILAIGEVIKKGDNLPSGKNHSNYIDKKGTYDIVGYMEHHKSMF